MKRLLHWIACHTVAIVLLIFVLVAIVFRGPLFGILPVSDTEKEKLAESEQVNISGSSPTVDSVIKKQSNQQSDQLDTPDSAIEQLPAVSSLGANSISNADADMTPVKDEQMPTAEDQLTEQGKSDEPQLSEMNQSSQDYQFRPVEETPVENLAMEEDLLQKARKAYWNDELEKAKTLYFAYIDLNPDNPDGYGELGNLLSTMGDLDTAAEMYRKAADLLVKQGKTEQAAQLKEVLSSIEVIQKTAQ